MTEARTYPRTCGIVYALVFAAAIPGESSRILGRDGDDGAEIGLTLWLLLTKRFDGVHLQGA